MLYVNPLDSPNLSRIDTTKDPKAKEHLALQEFEHVFLFTLLQEMRKTVPIGGEDEKQNEEKELYSEMLDDALSGQMASSNQLGVAKQIETQLRAGEKQPLVKAALTGYGIKNAADVKPLRPSADK